MKRKKEKGIALPIAIVIILVLITLILALVIQSRTGGNLQKRAEKRIAQSYTADVIKGKMQDVFGSTSVDTAKLKEVGLSSLPPTPGGDVVQFKGKMGNIEFSGSFNGGNGPWSTYVPVPKEIDPKKFGFNGPKSPSYDPNKFPLPPNHSLIFVNVKAEGQPKRTFYYMFSNNSPYGLIAPKGQVIIRNGDALATNSPSPSSADKSITGHNFYVYAANKVEIDGKLTGTARTSVPKGESSVILGNKEAGKIEEGMPPIPPDELQKIIAAVTEIMSSLKNNSKDPGFKEMAIALAGAMALFKGHGLVDTNGFSFDGKHLVWNNSFIVPPNMTIAVPMPLKINGDLLLMDGATMMVGGDLEVDGHLFIDEESSLMAQGDLDIKDRVEVTFSTKEMMGISAAIMAEDDITLHKGVRHLKFKPGSGNTDFGFNLLPCPFPEYIKVGGKKIKNPVAIAFKKMQQKVWKPLKKAMGPLAMFVTGKVSIPFGNEDKDIPGILIVSQKGSVKIKDNGKDAGLAGLIICKKGAIVEFPPDGSGVFTGILITFEGNIEFFNVKYRYYPYYTAASVPIGNGKTKTIMIMPKPHIVAYGEYKK